MKIAIGTGNELKAKAIEKAMCRVYPDATFVAVDVESGVRADPQNDDEMMRGALNRAKRARDKEHADIGVGPEGGSRTGMFGSFVYGWVAIVDSEGRVGYGASPQVMLPPAVEAIMLGDHVGMAEAMARVSKESRERIRFERGTNGVLTGGLYDRKKEFEDATLCALARFVSPKFYDTEA